MTRFPVFASTPARSRKAAGWVVACLVLLLLAQVLGLVHGVVHVRAHGGGDAQVADPHRRGAALAQEADRQAPPHSHGEAPWPEGESQSLLASVFDGHEDGDPSCQVFDALGHHALWLLPAVAITGLPGRAVLRAMHGAFVARWAALYDARGPPARA
jgi:hypothetical protein